MQRRDFLRTTGALAAGLSSLPVNPTVAAEKRQKVLYFTRSTGHGHPVVYPVAGQKMSHTETILRQLGERANFDVEHTKDGRVFDGDLARFDTLVFYSNGSLTAPSKEGYPPVSPEGKKRLLDAVESGKGVVAFHTANASFRDPRCAILGGSALGHGSQQEARMLVTDPKFPGLAGVGKSFSMLEEWYAFRYLKKDLHVILVQETGPMKKAEGYNKKMYDRPPYPATWARMQGKGRIFYTSMGHREDVWTNPTFQQISLGALAWAMGKVEADVTPNMAKVTPEA